MSTTAVRESSQPTAEPFLGQQSAAHRVTRPPAMPSGPRRDIARQAILALPAEISWVPVARHCAAAVLAQWRLPSAARQSAELVVGELAANAAQHGRHDMTAHLSLHAGVLRISVTDSGDPDRPRPPEPTDADADEHGRGLAIVELLSDEVRVRQSSLGRSVSVVLRAATA
ncbi:ATP-binding protein [Streptomyces sp. NPDC015127]|uniref:ATP-binding protein n=1 Tax=Streptomyces sp. NPDC015127 TaxID=3364939 RepID=UPI003700BF12